MEGGGKKENVRETNKEMWQAEGKGLENNCDLQLRPTHFSSSLNLFYLHSFSIFFFFLLIWASVRVLVIPFIQAAS